MPTAFPAVVHSTQAGDGLRRLEAIMAILRGPDGCPWDREQTLASLKPYLIEEAYELLETIDTGDTEHHREELGDVLLQVVFQTQLRKEEGAFELDDVAHGIADKLVRRHPHVFGDVQVSGSADVLRNWEAIKRREGRSETDAPRSPLAGVPATLPALLRAQRIQSKCAKAGFGWTALHDVRAKVAEETADLGEAIATGDKEAIQSALGDLLFALSGLARFLDVDAEDALRAATGRFIRLFEDVETSARGNGVDLRTFVPSP
jgi:MazG family protein